jgi:tetratricopeptide (TPR) repeat protein
MSSSVQFLLEHLTQALEQRDYRWASELLQQLRQEAPDHPWVPVYRAQLYEVTGNSEQAESLYRQILRQVTNAKITARARQGLERLQQRQQAQRQAAIAQALTDSPNGEEPGLLVLDAIAPEQRPAAAEHLARVMDLDLYSARLQLPSRGWRIYRLGAMAELQVYGQALRQGPVPAFWVAKQQIQSLPVLQVHYLQADAPKVVVICQNRQGQLGEMRFHWSEVSQMVEGALPIFEQVVDTDLRHGTQRQRKPETQDYAQVCDLHLPKYECCLRFCDRSYQFHQGLWLSAEASIDQVNTRIQWNALMARVRQHAPDVPIWSEFQRFAPGAMEFRLLLEQLAPQLQLFGQDHSLWCAAFQLYSGLAFWRDRGALQLLGLRSV